MTKSNFGDDYKKLEEVVSWFEGEAIDIDLAMEKFEEGVKLVEKLQKQLDSAESKISELKLKYQ